MDVALSADGWSVSKPLGDCFDCAKQIFFGLGFGIEFFEFLERHRREDSSTPGAKIFGGEIGVRNFPQVFVYVAGGDIVVFAVVTDELKKFLARDRLAVRHNFCETPVFNLDLVMLAALPAKLETNGRTFHVGMTILHGGEP